MTASLPYSGRLTGITKTLQRVAVAVSAVYETDPVGGSEQLTTSTRSLRSARRWSRLRQFCVAHPPSKTFTTAT